MQTFILYVSLIMSGILTYLFGTLAISFSGRALLPEQGVFAKIWGLFLSFVFSALACLMILRAQVIFYKDVHWSLGESYVNYTQSVGEGSYTVYPYAPLGIVILPMVGLLLSWLIRSHDKKRALAHSVV